MLKPGGLFAFTCASTGRPEHGTLRTRPYDSYTTLTYDAMWSNYYKNLTKTDILEAIPCHDIFSSFAFYYNSDAKDLYFVGLKKGNNPCVLVPYIADMVDEL